MIRGLFNTAGSMMTQMRRQEIITNNLSNMTTPGYKQDRSSLSTFGEVLLHTVEKEGMNRFNPVGTWTRGTVMGGFNTDLSQGGIRETGRTLDFAINGDGFFAINTPQGVRLTRSGSFHVDQQGRLITSQGYAVRNATGGEITVGANGVMSALPAIMVPGGNGAVIKQNDGLFVAQTALAAGNGRLMQSSLEQSNVDQVAQIAESLTIVRTFESGQRVMMAHDELLGKAANEIGKV